MSYVRNFGNFGKAGFAPPPTPPPEDVAPTLTPEEEQRIVQSVTPAPLVVEDDSFVSRNVVPLSLTGGLILLGVVGSIFLLT